MGIFWEEKVFFVINLKSRNIFLLPFTRLYTTMPLATTLETLLRVGYQWINEAKLTKLSSFYFLLFFSSSSFCNFISALVSEPRIVLLLHTIRYNQLDLSQRNSKRTFQKQGTEIQHSQLATSSYPTNYILQKEKQFQKN